MFGMLAHVACWSYDYWLDINNEDDELRDPDQGPNRHEVVLVRTWPRQPSPEEVLEELGRLRFDYLEQSDGHAELQSHVVIDDQQWRFMATATGTTFEAQARKDTLPLITSRLSSAVVPLFDDISCTAAREVMRLSGAPVSTTPRDALRDDQPATIRYY